MYLKFWLILLLNKYKEQQSTTIVPSVTIAAEVIAAATSAGVTTIVPSVTIAAAVVIAAATSAGVTTTIVPSVTIAAAVVIAAEPPATSAGVTTPKIAPFKQQSTPIPVTTTIFKNSRYKKLESNLKLLQKLLKAFSNGPI